MTISINQCLALTGREEHYYKMSLSEKNVPTLLLMLADFLSYNKNNLKMGNYYSKEEDSQEEPSDSLTDPPYASENDDDKKDKKDKKVDKEASPEEALINDINSVLLFILKDLCGNNFLGQCQIFQEKGGSHLKRIHAKDPLKCIIILQLIIKENNLLVHMNTENFFMLYSDYKTVVMDFFKPPGPNSFASDI